jgi:hypothetical protein
MARLRRFEEHRWIGTRDDMVYYDCDDPLQFAHLSNRVEDDALLDRRQLQSFAPDEPAEARNQGFRQA